MQQQREGAWISGQVCSTIEGPGRPSGGGPAALACLHWVSGHFSLHGSGAVFHEAGCGALLTGSILNTTDLARELGIAYGDCINHAGVALRAFRRWNDRFAEHLHGEFACVLWDSAAARVLLARDLSGFYPLYYRKSGAGLQFASDLRELLQHSPPQINEQHVARWLALGPAAPGDTFFQEAYAVPPGSVMAYEAGNLRQVARWQPEQIEPLHLRDTREYAARLTAVLETAVSERSAAMPASGTLLSGGLDSSAITALAARAMQGAPLTAFTAVPSVAAGEAMGRFSDERSRAAAVAGMYPNVQHVLVPHGRHGTFAMIDQFSSAELQPIFNPANYDWLYETSLQAAACGLTHLHMALAGNLTVSYNGGRALGSLIRSGYLMRTSRLALQLRRRGGYRWRGLLFHFLRPVLPSYACRWMDAARGAPSDVHAYSLINRRFSQAGGFTSSPREVHGGDSITARIADLRRIDPGAAIEGLRTQTGISATDATMDRRVVEFCLSVPEEVFCLHGVPRALIRTAMQGMLPEAVRCEHRRGLQAADFGLHFQGEVHEALAEVERLRSVPMAARMLDLPAMQVMLHDAHRQRGAQSQMLFWPKLMRALSLGRFLRRVEDGTILTCDASGTSRMHGPF